MHVEIHDVDHGGCAVITSPAGHRLMLDCGLNAKKSWFPSVEYSGKRIDTLMLLNLDEDHCEDLTYLWQSCPLGAIVSNPTVTAHALRTMKAQHGMNNGVETAAGILERFGDGIVGDWSNDLGGIQWHAFWNRYGTDFSDANNLSLAVFVTFGGVTILFGGDLHCAGWRKLLELPAFRAKLYTSHVFVASHHGRDNGRCPEMFRFWRPELIIFSDGPKQFETQETHSWYAERALGIPDHNKPRGPFGTQPMRKVMTTRNDGTIYLNVPGPGRYLVDYSKRVIPVNPFAAFAAQRQNAPIGKPFAGLR